MKLYSMSKYLIALFAVFVVSCSDGNQQPKKAFSQKKESSKTYKLKFGHDMPTESPQHLAAKKFKETVESKSGGRLQIEIFPNQSLGTDQEMIEQAIEGSLDIILPPTAKLGVLVPSAQYLDLPFFFEDREEVYELLDGKPGEIIKDQVLSKGLIGVSFWESGFKHFTSNKEIHSPADFKGLKVRVMKNRFLVDQYKTLGGNSFFIDFLKIYDALKDGVINAQENSLVSIKNLKLYEQQSHLTLSEHGYIGYLLSFSKKTYDQLPKDLQEILFKTGLEITPFEREETLKREKLYLEALKKTKIKITKLTIEEKKMFKTFFNPLLEKYRGVIGYKLLEITDQIKNAKIPVSEDEIIIGLDADLFSGSAPSGYSIKRGAQIAINEINNSGGLLGKKIRLISKDHSGISARGIKNIEDFSRIKNLVAVLGGIHSPVALSELKTIHQKKMIYLDPWAAATNIVSNGYEPNYVFRVSVRDEDAGPFLVNQTLKKYKKIALLLENTGWGRSNHKSMGSVFEKKGIQPATVQWFNWKEPNLYKQLFAVKNSDADAIILVSNAPEGETLIRNMIENDIILPVFSHWGITGGNFGKDLKDELKIIDLKALQTFSFLKPKNKKTKTFNKKYFGNLELDKKGNIEAPVGTAHAYDIVHLLALAIESANSLDREKIRKALENVPSYHGLVKYYRKPFSEKDHEALDSNDFFLAKYDEDGRIIPILN